MLPEAFTSTEIPANECAVFSHDGRRTGSDKPYILERYGDRFDPATGTGDIEMWIPFADARPQALDEFNPESRSY